MLSKPYPIDYSVAVVLFILWSITMGLGYGAFITVGWLLFRSAHEGREKQELSKVKEHEQVHAYALWWEYETGDPTLRKFHEKECVTILTCKWEPYTNAYKPNEQPHPWDELMKQVWSQSDDSYFNEDHIMSEVAKAFELEQTKAPVKQARKALNAPDPNNELLNSISFRARLFNDEWVKK